MNKLSITMLSNAMSHHQLPFCHYMSNREDVEFHFIATKPLSSERSNMGYDDLNHIGEFVICSYENEEQYQIARDLVDKSDFVIWGSAPYSFIRSRIMKKKWTFVYSERIFKNGLKDKKIIKKILYNFACFSLVSHERMGLLCASAYAAKDFKKFGFKKERMYKWGYFPPDTLVPLEELLSIKEENSIVWVGRMLSWKHPELAIELAELLKKNEIPYHLTMIGDGILYEKIKMMIQEKGLSKNVTMTGSLPKDEVRKRMEASEILLATSDYAEGWGAVINEGMNSACAVVASHAMGATPFLIRDGENGQVFISGNNNELYEKISRLLLQDEERVRIQKNAFDTIRNEWNGENAGRKLIHLCNQLKEGDSEFSYSDGVCSLAKVDI